MTSSTSSISSSGHNSNDSNNLGEERVYISEEQPLDPRELVYEELDDAAIDEDDAPHHELINELEAQDSSEKLYDVDVEHISGNAEINGANEEGHEQEDDAFIPEAEILEDDSIVYATEDAGDRDDDRPPESPTTALTGGQRMLASAADYQNVDVLLDEQLCDPEEYLEAGGLDDVNDPARDSTGSVCTLEDQMGAEELVIVDVDHSPGQQEGLEELQEEEQREIETYALLRTSAAPAHGTSDHQAPLASHQQASELKTDESNLDNDGVEHASEPKTDIQEKVTDPGTHPAIAQAIRTRNEHFPLLDDPKLPHTRENFNLPPLVEGHSVPVDKGTYKDYIFDLERQEYLQKEEVTKAHTEYLEKHHELKQIVSDFLTSVLIDKPSDVYQYAADYFSVAVN